MSLISYLLQRSSPTTSLRACPLPTTPDNLQYETREKGEETPNQTLFRKKITYDEEMKEAQSRYGFY